MTNFAGGSNFSLAKSVYCQTSETSMIYHYYIKRKLYQYRHHTSYNKIKHFVKDYKFSTP